MITSIEISFWISVIILAYIIIGYPIILTIISKYNPNIIRKAGIEPTVSIIIAAYNEEKYIIDRIQNCLKLNYPKEKFEIIVASDGSTDLTNKLVRSFNKQNVRLIAYSNRCGKLSVLNKTVPKTKGEILVFTDANSAFDLNAIRFLTRNFNDTSVGCVAGRKIIRQNNTGTSSGESIYWRYEHFLKKKETLIHSSIGADGSIYAIRKNLYNPPDDNVGFADDGIISMQVLCKGYRLVYDEKAKNYEDASTSLKGEFKRKIRTLSGGLEWIAAMPSLLSPFKSPIWWQLLSHRVLRFLIPYLLIISLVTSGVLSYVSKYYFIPFGIQLFIYIMGIGAMFDWRSKIFRISFYITFMNYVFIPALFRFLFSKTEIAWEKEGR